MAGLSPKRRLKTSKEIQPPKNAFCYATSKFLAFWQRCEIFHNLYGTHKTAHSRTGRSKREDLPRLLLADDRPSRPGFQRTLRENSAAAPATARHQTTGVPEHLLGL